MCQLSAELWFFASLKGQPTKRIEGSETAARYIPDVLNVCDAVVPCFREGTTYQIYGRESSALRNPCGIVNACPVEASPAS
ncbi:unnamed protein product [Larinioides sclopetarius]|uniref:Uncharacterized protein n=1 Tax=Larinioides sclopetarius TaxID=280406 RepID=A0AAV1YSW6_9ARAC